MNAQLIARLIINLYKTLFRSIYFYITYNRKHKKNPLMSQEILNQVMDSSDRLLMR